MKGRFLRLYLPLVFVLATLRLSTPIACAQWGGSSRGPDAFFDRLDRDGNGVIEPQEADNPFLARMLDRMGFDASREISRDEFSERMEQRRRDFGRRDGDDSDDGRRSWWRSRRGDRDDERGSSRDRISPGRDGSRSNSPSTRNSSAKSEPRPRVTVDLQDEFVAGDADRDGQIGLYEWKRWKPRAALGEFLGLDSNGDGFLTPRELKRADEAQPVDIATALPSPPPLIPDQTVRPPASFRAPEKPAELQMAIAEADEQEVKRAKRYFSLLDRDHDGSISEMEWVASRRIKPRFEQAGVDLAQPMSSEQFVGYYVRIFAADGSS